MKVILTSPQAMAVYLVARQALTCTYYGYLATDFDTLRMPCLFFFHNKGLDFNVYILRNTYRLCPSSISIDASHMQLWVR